MVHKPWKIEADLEPFVRGTPPFPLTKISVLQVSVLKGEHGPAATLATIDWTEVLDNEISQQGLRHSVLLKLDRASLLTYAEAGKRAGDIEQVLDAVYYMHDLAVNAERECSECGAEP